MEKFLKKFRLDRHHVMERFGVVFLLLVAMLSFTIAMTFIKYRKDSKETLSSQAIYTTDFTTSRTEIQGSVYGVFTNKQKTKALVMLKFNNIESLSVDAKNYQVFLTGSSPSGAQAVLQSHPVGCIYMFGHTGYMGIYLVDNQGFPSQIINMTIRNNKELSEVDEDSVPVYDDKSFEKYDQMSVYFNPGASGTMESDALNQTEAATPSSIYAEMVAFPMEKEYKQTLNEDLKQMQILIRKIMDYRSSRFVNDGIAVPDTPSELKGDSIKEGENGLYYYKTEFQVPGSYDVNWQEDSLQSGGYADKLLNGMSFSEFFAKKQKEKDESDYTPSWNGLEWFRKDGSRIVMGDTTLEYEKAIQSDIEGYRKALDDYYALKTKYMVDDSYNLVLLEANTEGLDSFYTVKQDDDTLYIY